ncbi:hypothetical protein [Fibrobacter sp.]|uniref:hypothetical protein n=1 Tax=Fibrobacter sp. TaxID=35828 RepID=UPI00388D3679
MPIDKKAFSAGSFKLADKNSTGSGLSADERLRWNNRVVRSIVGEAHFDKTAFSTRKF